MTISPLFLFDLTDEDCYVKLKPYTEIGVCFTSSVIGDFLVARHGGKVIQRDGFKVWRLTGKSAKRLLKLD